MNEELLLQKLAGASRGQGPPALDVADSVLASLRVRRQSSRMVVWFATAASVAAMLLAVLALYALKNSGASTIVGPDVGMIGSL